jgi:hypothetical protein
MVCQQKDVAKKTCSPLEASSQTLEGPRRGTLLFPLEVSMAEGARGTAGAETCECSTHQQSRERIHVEKIGECEEKNKRVDA